MKKIIRLTERDLTRIVKRVIKENEDQDGEKFRYGPEHAINSLNRDVKNFIKSQDLDKEESFRRLDYFIQRNVKPVLDKVKETGYWSDEEIDHVIRYLKFAYNYDYSSGTELPRPNFKEFKENELNMVNETSFMNRIQYNKEIRDAKKQAKENDECMCVVETIVSGVIVKPCYDLTDTEKEHIIFYTKNCGD